MYIQWNCDHYMYTYCLSQTVSFVLSSVTKILNLQTVEENIRLSDQ